MGRGTTPEDPVTEEWTPDLKLSRHEIDEYLQEKGVYGIFDFLMKELLTKQPANPLAHLKACLECDYPTGPLKIVVTGPPGLDRSALSKKLAETWGLPYIGAGELLEKAGLKGVDGELADEQKVANLVMPKLQEASDNMQGWVLDGFPRTRLQTTYLKESAMVPAHVLFVQGSENQIRERNAAIERGELEGKWIDPELLEKKLRVHLCYGAAALDIYKDRISVIDTQLGEDFVFSEMVRKTRMVQRSKGPHPPPRIALLGPRGVGLQEHASRLAARLGCVLVDGKALELEAQEKIGLDMSARPSGRCQKQTQKGKDAFNFHRSTTSLDIANQDKLISEDPLGVVGVRLRQPDCVKQGWVLCGFPDTADRAHALQEDVRLRPTRVVALSPSEETCVQRLRNILRDPVTGNIWMSLPRNEKIRSRLVRNPEDQPSAVIATHTAFCNSLPGIFKGFEADARCLELPADGPPILVFKELTEFVERPLPLPEPQRK